MLFLNVPHTSVSAQTRQRVWLLNQVKIYEKLRFRLAGFHSSSLNRAFCAISCKFMLMLFSSFFWFVCYFWIIDEWDERVIFYNIFAFVAYRYNFLFQRERERGGGGGGENGIEFRKRWNTMNMVIYRILELVRVNKGNRISNEK